MIPQGPLQPPLAALFAVLVAVLLVRLVRADGWRDRATLALSLAMCVSMFAMVFAWGVNRFVGLQVLVFAGGAAWLLVRALGPGEPAAAAEDRASAEPAGPLQLGYHAAMMLGMVWMNLAMRPHGRPTTGHLAMIGYGQPVALFGGAALAAVFAAGGLTQAVALARGGQRGHTLAELGMSLGMLAMTAPMLAF